MGMGDIPEHIPATNVFVCVGHGSLNTVTDKDNLAFTVPRGVWIAFWVWDGETAAGKSIEEYRQDIKQVDARVMRGTDAGADGFAPRARAMRHMGGVLSPEVSQSLAAAAAAASAASAAASSAAAAAAAPAAAASAAAAAATPAAAMPLAGGTRRQAWAPGQLGAATAQALETAHQQGIAAGEFAAMQQELATNRGILRPVVKADTRSPRLNGLPQVYAPGSQCPSYRLTYDPAFCNDYVTGGKNSTNAGLLPAFLVADPRIARDRPIAERGSLLRNYAQLVSTRAPNSIIHWAACRAHLDR
jgi:hypothetical protein